MVAYRRPVSGVEIQGSGMRQSSSIASSTSRATTRPRRVLRLVLFVVGLVLVVSAAAALPILLG